MQMKFSLESLDVKFLSESLMSCNLVSAKLVPVGYGIKKLQIGCVVEDDKVSDANRNANLVTVGVVMLDSPVIGALQVGTDILEEKISEFEDYVQSMDVAAFNKI